MSVQNVEISHFVRNDILFIVLLRHDASRLLKNPSLKSLMSFPRRRESSLF